MTPEQSAAYVIAMSACAAGKVAGMVAQNDSDKLVVGRYPTFNASDFNAVAEEFGIHHNAVMSLFQSSTP